MYPIRDYTTIKPSVLLIIQTMHFLVDLSNPITIPQSKQKESADIL
jgi:hypothetical protein